MVLEQAIRQRSYEIWQREGCPEGKAVEHWLQAGAELEAEQRAASFPWGGTDCRAIVVPRLPISPPPRRVTSRRATRTAA
jgi:Protein of unknown function (DUF2934)